MALKDLDDILESYDEKESEDETTDSVDENVDNSADTEDENANSEDQAKDKELLDKRVDQIIPLNLSSCMKESFLSYAMSVIVARALPDARDGLKPVQRRILYAMNDLGVYCDKPHKKSARIVGDVIGKYHPHGDTAVYEAMVRMAQDFSYRYPLIEGHGNFGSIDGDGAAAMRYTEARLSKLSAEMLKDLNKNTVDFVDNYDGSEKEPEVLPTRIPNILVNGVSGIAVGMATNIPTHNLDEIIDATLELIRNPEATVEKLMDYVPAPDFPTGAKIIGLQGVKKAYETGIGSFVCRAKTEIKSFSNGKKEIIVKEIPYQVNKSKLIERIAELAKSKAIEGITDLRDESNREGMKIVIELRRDANENVILNNLFKYTPLQSNFSVNMIALDHGQPKLMSLKGLIQCFIDHQISIVTRRTEFDLARAKSRLHIVDGLLIALASIDEVIKTIKEARSPEIAITSLIEKFLLSEIQAKAILDMKLQRLTGLEIEKLQNEKKELQEFISTLEEILANHDKLMGLIVDELTEIKNKYNDPRRTEIDMTSDLDVEDEDLIPQEDVIVTVTSKGYVKRMSPDTYRVQKRGGKGITGAKIQEDDYVERLVYTSTHDHLLFITNFGKIYDLKAYKIPLATRFSKGLPIVNLLKLDSGEKLAALLNVSSLEEEGALVFATKLGNIKKTLINKYENIRSTGIKAIVLNEGDEVISVEKINKPSTIILGASNGKAVRFDADVIRYTNRTAAGVKAIKLEENDVVVGMIVSESDDEEVIILTENGYGKRTKTAAFKVKGRNGKGVKYINTTEKSGQPVAISKCSSMDDLIVITNKGMIIRTPLKDISSIGRDTQGVRIISLNDEHKVAAIVVIDSSANKE